MFCLVVRWFSDPPIVIVNGYPGLGRPRSVSSGSRQHLLEAFSAGRRPLLSTSQTRTQHICFKLGICAVNVRLCRIFVYAAKRFLRFARYHIVAPSPREIERLTPINTFQVGIPSRPLGATPPAIVEGPEEDSSQHGGQAMA